MFSYRVAVIVMVCCLLDQLQGYPNRYAPTNPGQTTSLTGATYSDFWCAFCIHIQHARCIELFCANPPYPYRPNEDNRRRYLHGGEHYVIPRAVDGYQVSPRLMDTHELTPRVWDEHRLNPNVGLVDTNRLPHGIMDSYGVIPEVVGNHQHIPVVIESF